MPETEIYVARGGRAALTATRGAAAPSAYSVVVRFEGGLTETQKNAFKAAADRWSRVIVGDLPAVNIGGEVIDDLRAHRDDLATTVIPALSLVEQMAVHRAPLPVFAPRSRVTRSYEDLWAEVSARSLRTPQRRTS